MKKRRLRFFLDYGMCFWGIDYEDGFYGGMSAKDLSLSLDVQRQVNTFLKEYGQYYSWGCPPSEGWTVDNCRRFNAEYKRILNIVTPELANDFLLCQEQLDLIEDPEVLAEFYRRPRDVIEERRTNYYVWKDEFAG